MGQGNGRSLLRGNLVLLVRSLGVTIGGTQGKYELGSRPPTCPEGDPVWTSSGVLVVSKTDRDGGIRTRQIPVTGNTGYLCMLDDLGSARPRASIEPQKGRGSTKHVLPTPSTAAHRHGYFLIYFFCIELNCNRFFCAFALPTRVAFGTHGFVNQIVHTYIYTNSRLAPKRIPFALPSRCKGKPDGISIQMAVCESHKHLLSD